MSVRVITRTGSRRVARAAFELARQRRRHLTVRPQGHRVQAGLRHVRRGVPQGRARVSRTCASTTSSSTRSRCGWCATRRRFDVVVTTNMFGDILSDEAAGLVGGLGMAPGLCIGDGDVAMAQATHGSAPDIAGRGIANPYAMIESTRMLLDWLGHSRGRPEAVAAAAAMSARRRCRARRSRRAHRRHPRAAATPNR